MFRAILSLAVAFLPLAAAHAGGKDAPKVRRPNVVIILSDDQGWGDLSLHGNKNLSTPHLDGLARGGAAFRSFFVQPVCSPTRAEMLTGRYHTRVGVRGVSTGQERLNLGEITLAHLLRGAGYRTGAFGKWHNGSQWPYHPNAQGFQTFYGFTSGHWGEYFDPPLERNGQPVRGKGYIADDITDKAIAFLDECVPRRKPGNEPDPDREPFFCYVAYSTPHSPFCVPDADWDRAKNRPIVQLGVDGKKEDLTVTRCVAAMCENLDRNVGRILQRLDELGVADDTIVVFLCDNGPNSNRWNGGFKGRKGSTDEGGVRSPCFVRWPGHIAPGAILEPIAGAIDLLPTVAALTSTSLPADWKGGNGRRAHLDGLDLSPFLLGRKSESTDRLLFAALNDKVSVRSQKFRLDAAGKLFDIDRDPGQSRDVSSDNPAIADRMKRAVAEWREEMAQVKKVDRPFTVGFSEFPRTVLPARDGVAKGGIRRSAPAPNCSYFTHWTAKDDAITWDVEVREAGVYRVELLYTCSEKNVGAVVEMTFRDARAALKIATAWDPPLIDDQDRVPRKGESFLKEFRSLAFGPVTLPAGRGELAIHATDIPGSEVADIRAIILTRVR